MPVLYCRLGIWAFESILVVGHAISLQEIVRKGSNANFVRINWLLSYQVGKAPRQSWKSLSGSTNC